MSKPLVVIINGKGGVGKDTVCKVVEENVSGTYIFSSITPIKAIAKKIGWNGEKTDKARKFLSDLKDLCTEYNDMPLRYMEKRLLYTDYYHHSKIIFFHIREPEEIEKFKQKVLELHYKCKTLLIRSDRIKSEYGNHADDDVENYPYDCIYDNNGRLEDLETDFMDFFKREVME